MKIALKVERERERERWSIENSYKVKRESRWGMRPVGGERWKGDEKREIGENCCGGVWVGVVVVSRGRKDA